MQGITLDAMDGCALMNRVDSKYVLSTAQLADLLTMVAERYSVLEIENNRCMPYESLYFDTAEHQAYQEHHNGRMNRYKYRIRRYVVSDVSYLEIKRKNNKGRTSKVRRPLEPSEYSLTVESKEFIHGATGRTVDLHPQLWSRFSRITLVAPEYHERATIDLELSFSHEGAEASIPGIVIAEVKQAVADANSPLRLALKRLGVREMRVSKYCLGCMLLKPQLKYNRFKSRLGRIRKISSQEECNGSF